MELRPEGAGTRLTLTEMGAFLDVDEDVVEEDAGEHRAERQQAQRHQHRPRAFVRMKAAGAGGHFMRLRLVRPRVVAGILLVGVIVMVAVCATVPPGTVNPWDAIIGQNGLALEQGKGYTLTFTAVADAPSVATHDVTLPRVARPSLH